MRGRSCACVNPRSLSIHSCLRGFPLPRFAYTGYKSYGSVTRRLLDGYASKAGGQGGNSTAGASLPEPERDYNVDENDAMETIYAWLHSRIPHTRGPQAEAAQQQPGAAAKPGGSKKASRKEAAEPAE